MLSNHGMETTISYISLEVLSATLGLPKGYLKDLADSGEIPCLDVNGRRRFNYQVVRETLDSKASEGTCCA